LYEPGTGTYNSVPAAGLRDPVTTGYDFVGEPPAKSYFIELVPDNVARVRIRFTNGTAYRRAHHNVVIVHDPPTAPNEQLRSVTWYGSSGHVLPTSHKAWQHAIANMIAADSVCIPAEPNTIASQAACFAAYARTH